MSLFNLHDWLREEKRRAKKRYMKLGYQYLAYYQGQMLILRRLAERLKREVGR